MPRTRLAPALGAVALCSLLGAGCGTGGPPSQGETRDDIQNQLIDQDVAAAAAGEVADCVSRGLYESGDFTADERDDVVRATDGDPPDPALVVKVETLIDGCADDAGVELPDASG